MLLRFRFTDAASEGDCDTDLTNLDLLSSLGIISYSSAVIESEGNLSFGVIQYCPGNTTDCDRRLRIIDSVSVFCST